MKEGVQFTSLLLQNPLQLTNGVFTDNAPMQTK